MVYVFLRSLVVVWRILGWYSVASAFSFSNRYMFDFGFCFWGETVEVGWKGMEDSFECRICGGVS